ncbi:MAG: efflux RND transporter periplasmic adaptor subunit [Massilibacteroides sp.]|nr:efflux RND transporter periplasmic adaptor subunit [Massilibacteroides sp.]MDD4116229.1 efflux RND transporter periplasmic adaptor subunit [Massilibacteroides sp.]
MKTLKRIIKITVGIALVALIVFLLMKNRKAMQEELTAMQNYNEIVPVETATARIIDFSPKFRESGLYFSNSDVQVISETQGRIVTLHFQVGDKVCIGQVLATVENEVIKSQYELAKENLAKAEKDLERFKTLEGGDAVTQQQLEVAKLAWQQAQTNLAERQKQLENATLKASVSGTISERHADQGTWLSQGMPVCTISDQSRMNFQVKQAGEILSKLSVGQPVNLQADGLPGQIFNGKVKNIGVTADLSGRYLVEIDVPNPNHLLRSGMIGDAVFYLPAEKNKLVIPRKCIDGSLQQAHVFVVSNDKVTRRPVIIELLSDKLVSIIKGLQPGEEVVTTGLINLTDGTSVRVLNQ